MNLVDPRGNDLGGPSLGLERHPSFSTYTPELDLRNCGLRLVAAALDCLNPVLAGAHLDRYAEAMGIPKSSIADAAMKFAQGVERCLTDPDASLEGGLRSSGFLSCPRPAQETVLAQIGRATLGATAAGLKMSARLEEALPYAVALKEVIEAGKSAADLTRRHI